MVHWYPLHSRAFSAARRLVLSIHIFTLQSRANASLIHSIHVNIFTPFARMVATKCFMYVMFLWMTVQLETGIGGVKSLKIRGGVKILNFQPLKLTPFYRDSIETRQFRGPKVQVFEGQLSGRVPPPLYRSVRFEPPLSQFLIQVED